MINDPTDGLGQLYKKTILLMVEAPAELFEERTPADNDLQVRFEEAVISFTRAILSENGRIVVDGDPEISLLVATIAGEYVRPRPAERWDTNEPVDDEHAIPLVIYLPESFNELFQNDIQLILNAGYADIRQRHTIDEIIRDTLPSALVCIGGRGEKIPRTVIAFREIRHRAPIYAMATTGGAVNLLSGESVRMFDNEILQRVADVDKDSQDEIFSEGQDILITPPYPVIMQAMVGEIARQD